MIAILGGTFDPVHVGHLRAAWEASEVLNTEVRLMPANVPPHRPQPVANAEQRVAILRAALRDQNRLRLVTRELARQGPSYSTDTLAGMRNEVGPDKPLALLVGADAFAGLPTWHNWHELFDLAHICVLTRPGTQAKLPDELAVQLQQRACSDATQLQAAPSGRIMPIAVTALDVSASAIRALLAAGRMPCYLMPDAVLDEPNLLAPYRNTSTG